MKRRLYIIPNINFFMEYSSFWPFQKKNLILCFLDYAVNSNNFSFDLMMYAHTHFCQKGQNVIEQLDTENVLGRCLCAA